MSCSNFKSDLDLLLVLTDDDGFLEVSYPTPELHDAILQKGYRVINELSEFTLYKLITFK